MKRRIHDLEGMLNEVFVYLAEKTGQDQKIEVGRLQYKSYPKRLTTMTFAEIGVCFSSTYHNWPLKRSKMAGISSNLRLV